MEMSQRNSLSNFLKQTTMTFFYKNREQESKTSPVWGLVPVGAGRILGKAVGA
jgi:hypothetical protein